MSVFFRATLYTAAYTALSVLATGSAGAAALDTRSKTRGGLGRWLFIVTVMIMLAALVGARCRIENGVLPAMGSILLAVAVIMLPTGGRIISAVPIPLAVFFSSAGFSLPVASLIGGFCGLSLAAGAELALGAGGKSFAASKIRVIAAVAFVTLGIMELFGV